MNNKPAEKEVQSKYKDNAKSNSKKRLFHFKDVFIPDLKRVIVAIVLFIVVHLLDLFGFTSGPAGIGYPLRFWALGFTFTVPHSLQTIKIKY